ncbi:hypothetical protein LCGC14_1235410 [marine sediment metagenome]|uniref:Uncharacterized protein n=1 Tax=marine sediment metagenome TaxID=412755 RepID=A0A0F9PBJ0_9ZZZZ
MNQIATLWDEELREATELQSRLVHLSVGKRIKELQLYQHIFRQGYAAALVSEQVRELMKLARLHFLDICALCRRKNDIRGDDYCERCIALERHRTAMATFEDK